MRSCSENQQVSNEIVISTFEIEIFLISQLLKKEERRSNENSFLYLVSGIFTPSPFPHLTGKDGLISEFSEH